MDDEISDTFVKRTGTTDLGKDYEDIRVAQIAIHLLSLGDDVSDFKIWSNDERYGSFDDVIAVIHGKNGEKIKTSMQLKHSQNAKKLTTSAFTGPKGDFSLMKYFKDYQEAKKKQPHLLVDYKMILQTNNKTYEIWKEPMDLDGIVLQAEQIDDPFDAFLGNHSDAKPLRFTIKEITKEVHQENVLEFEAFLQQFYLYPQQPNVEQTKQLASEQFRRIFLSGEVQPFFAFVQEWSKRDGKKQKLSKSLVSAKIAECLISPFLLSYPALEIDQNRDLFMDVIHKFDATLIDKENASKLGIILTQSDLKTLQVNKWNKYGITVRDVTDLNGKDLHKLLWHLHGRHLIVSLSADNSSIIAKAIDLCKLCEGRKFIFVADSKKYAPECFEKDYLCKSFDDLKRRDVGLCKKIGDTLKISLAGKQPIPLGDALDDEQVRRCLTPSHLLQMLDQSLLIGETKEELPNYINRSMTSFIIDSEYLQRMNTTENVALICSDNDFAQVQVRFPHCRQFTEDETGNSIYFCSSSQKATVFETICRNNSTKNCHCFELNAEDGSLKWMQSSKSIENLREYRKGNCSLSPEAELITSENHLVNLICDEPGMGKSWFLKKLEHSYPTKMVIRIEPKMHPFFNETATVQEYDKFVFSLAFKNNNPLNNAILKYLSLQKRVVILWDGLDEVSQRKLPNILEAIDYFKSRGLIQWLASRNQLREELENRFCVLARSITSISKTEQEQYIKQRLHLEDSSQLLDIVKNIMNNLKSEYVNEMFGIPLQLYMFTELFQHQDSNILELLTGDRLFSIATLYQHFLDGKFTFHDCEKTGLGLMTSNDQIANQLLELKMKREEDYEKAAMNVCFFMDDLEIDISCQSFLKDIRNGDGYGIITSIIDSVSFENTSANLADFAHITYAEFLAARYLTKHFRKIPTLKTYFFRDSYKNIRFFFDAIMAADSDLHLAVLYKDVEKVKRLEKRPDCKDGAGRNPLNLAASWGKYYFFFYEVRDLEVIRESDDVIAPLPSLPKDQALHDVCMELTPSYPGNEADHFYLSAFNYTSLLATSHRQSVRRTDKNLSDLERLVGGAASYDNNGIIIGKTIYQSNI